MQAMQRQRGDMFQAVAGVQRGIAQRRLRRAQAGFAGKVWHQGVQAVVQFCGQVHAITLAPQHAPGTRQQAGVRIAARTQQAGRP